MDGAGDADDDWLSGTIEKYLTQLQGDRIDRHSTPLHASALTITQSLTVARSSTVSLKFHRDKSIFHVKKVESIKLNNIFPTDF